MSFSPTPTQTLILWLLVGRGGGAWLDDIKPKLELKPRQQLEQARLITSEPRKRGRARPNWIQLTRAGWAWANDHLHSELPTKTQSAGPILQAWLTHLQAFMKRRGIALAEIIVSEEKPAANLEERIKAAYLQITHGAFNARVHLHRLREILHDVPRSKLDEALLMMQQRSKLVLFGLDNQRDITAEDRQAALHVSGEPRHVLRLGG